MTLPAGTTLPAPGDAREARHSRWLRKVEPGRIGTQIKNRRDEESW
jgi:hypothetical protein